MPMRDRMRAGRPQDLGESGGRPAYEVPPVQDVQPASVAPLAVNRLAEIA